MPGPQMPPPGTPGGEPLIPCPAAIMVAQMIPVTGPAGCIVRLVAGHGSFAALLTLEQAETSARAMLEVVQAGRIQLAKVIPMEHR